MKKEAFSLMLQHKHDLSYPYLRFLTLFFPMFPFDPPENIRKPGFLMFSGGSKREHWQEKG